MMHFLVSRGSEPTKGCERHYCIFSVLTLVLGDFKGRTPLHWAARYGRVLSVAYLLQLRQVDINQQDHKGFTVSILINMYHGSACNNDC